MSTQGYARPELLVETEWLAEHLSDPGIRVVDCDPPDAYLRAHIPGAVYFVRYVEIRAQQAVSATLYRVFTTGGNIDNLGELPFWCFAYVAISNDGSRMACAVDETETDVFVIDNVPFR